MDFLVDFLLNFYGPVHYLFVFGVLLLCGFGIPIPEDITLIVAGVISYYGLTDVHLMTVVGFFGVMFGDSTIFLLGQKYGMRLSRAGLFSRVLTPERLESVSATFRKRGNKMLFAARFMPGVRTAMFFSAGTLGIPFRVFFFYDGLAALLSVPLIVYSVFYFGDELDQVVRWIKRIEHGIIFVILAVVGFAVVKWVLSKRKIKRQEQH